ncbi:hypothetical protein NZ698_04825 [Chryseobacterium sp. PBS4-4]|uniref:Lipoprotein n=1 Tax=Chryseobacterium edaphi TaxID=2976532 RepID=A0ABT2W2R5_9FLAO|nr:hypothetical protein [Chryseobacterium edaphi]MCU7616511.1 hypothetical protein [Chryseobacterium edaphi]
MKKLFLISSLIIIISCKKENDKTLENDVTQEVSNSKINKDSLQLKNDLHSVDGIKKEYNLVNSKLTAKKLDSVSFDYECEERSGNVVYYSEKGILKVVKHFNADSHFSSTENYFVNDGKPYFVFKDDTVWSFDGGTPEKPETKDDITEQRFYIVEGKPIQCLEKKYTLKSSSKNNPKSENVHNKEMKNCSIDELQKTFNLLMKNKEKKGKMNCL